MDAGICNMQMAGRLLPPHLELQRMGQSLPFASLLLASHPTPECTISVSMLAAANLA